MSDKMVKYIEMALSEGANHAVAVRPDEIVFDGRTLLKCMFGCKDWGKGCTCPSKEGFLKPWEIKPLLCMYHSVLIIHSNSKQVAQDVAYLIEREAYFDGDALAFSMSDCAICANCAGKTGENCRDPQRARPAFHSVGIDVFSTVNKLGLPLKALTHINMPQNWYSAVWLNTDL